MSILKSIIHHWNGTSKSYDTLHPETEYAQVTDFGQGTIAHLISSTLASTVTACSTGSVFGKLVEKLLDASGMRYNFSNSNAWYLCLGSLFGGLIIQGGKQILSTTSWTTISLPVAAIPFGAIGIGWTTGAVFGLRCHDDIADATFFELPYDQPETFSYIAFCR